MKWTIAATVVVALLCSGCKMHKVSIVGDKPNTLGTVIAWEPTLTAAMVVPGNAGRMDRVCMQNALGMKALEGEAQADVSAAILNASEAMRAAATKSAGEFIAASGSFSQSVALLTTSTERTTFLGTGMFYICQLTANETLSPSDAQQLIVELIRAASLMESGANKASADAAKTAKSPAVPAPVPTQLPAPAPVAPTPPTPPKPPRAAAPGS